MKSRSAGLLAVMMTIYTGFLRFLQSKHVVGYTPFTSRSLSYDGSIASFKASYSDSASQSFLIQFQESSTFLKVIQ